MMDLDALYVYAEQHDIDVDWYILNRAESLSAPLFDGSCVIALDPTKIADTADHKTKLGHETGHCVHGAFYNRYSPFDVRQRHENKADKWAILHLVPESDLKAAVRNGITEPWELAEHFGVTEPFMRKAMWYYRYGNLNVEWPD